MDKVGQIDFILHEDEFSKLIFRFLPGLSHCHSFNEQPPKSWDEVYKVYYAYEIVEEWQGDEPDILASFLFDECSDIENVGYYLSNNWFKTLEDDDSSEIFAPLGGGVTWYISRNDSVDQYEFQLWKSNGIGYRFFLHPNQCPAFGKFLVDCCEYMLAHGEPI